MISNRAWCPQVFLKERGGKAFPVAEGGRAGGVRRGTPQGSIGVGITLSVTWEGGREVVLGFGGDVCGKGKEHIHLRKRKGHSILPTHRTCGGHHHPFLAEQRMHSQLRGESKITKTLVDTKKT